VEQGRDFVHRRVSRELLPKVLACGKADASCDDHSRIKNLVKVRRDRYFRDSEMGADTDFDAHLQLSGGEYIAVEKLESVYKSTSVVGEGMILANPQHRQPAMIVCIHHVNFPQFVKSQNLGGGSEDLDKLCRDKEVEKAVLRELNANGKKQGFSNLELLESVILTPDEW
jgi:hypothetical protein